MFVYSKLDVTSVPVFVPFAAMVPSEVALDFVKNFFACHFLYI